MAIFKSFSFNSFLFQQGLIYFRQSILCAVIVYGNTLIPLKKIIQQTNFEINEKVSWQQRTIFKFDHLVKQQEM